MWVARGYAFIYAIIVLDLLATSCSSPAIKNEFEVNVEYELSGEPVTGETVEVLLWTGQGRKTQGVTAQQSLDARGVATFYLPAGQYLVRMKSGYVGQKVIEIEEDGEIILKVIPVFQ